MSLARLGFLLAVAASAPAPVPAQTPAAPQIIAIRAGRLVDVERGEVRRDQLILIRGERITAVQPAPPSPPAGARVIDLSPLHASLPGLIDCHTHLIGDAHRRRRAAPARALRGPGGVQRRAERAEHAAGGIHHGAGRRDLPRLRGRRAARRDQRRHRDRAPDGGGRRVRDRHQRRGRAGRGGARRAPCPPAYRFGVANSAWTRSASGSGRSSTAAPTSSRSSPPGRCSPRAPSRASPSTPRRRSVRRWSRRRSTAPSSPRTPTAPKGSSARCARACARSSTAR